MVRFDVITLFPAMFAALNYGITQQAFTQQQAQINLWNPRDYSPRAHGYVDDRPYGGGPGMVMQAPPLANTVHAIQQHAPEQKKVILLSPHGAPWQQKHAHELAASSGCILVCGRYEGIDQRFIDQWVTDSVSLGDFILSGGELGAMTLMDSVLRLCPNVLGNEASSHAESFSHQRLSHPQYTRPEVYLEDTVPTVLRQGNAKMIAQWRKQQALVNTYQKRPDLLAQTTLDEEEKTLLNAYIKTQTGEADVDS
jgi:tRNA (guanine37-N1)-methyltransferase